MRMVEFQRPTRSGSKAGSQFSLSCRALSTGASWMLEQGMLNFDPTKSLLAFDFLFWIFVLCTIVSDSCLT